MTDAHTWEAPLVDYAWLGDNRVQTDGTYRQKVTGTAMGGLMGISPWQTPFSMSTKLMGLWDEDIGNQPQVIAGKLLESRIIEYADKTYEGAFYKAEDIFGKRSGKHVDWKSDFEDDVFAGHVDGIVSKDGEDYILEVKTTSERGALKWSEHPPTNYLWQVYLYNHYITKQDKAYILLGVMDAMAYANPNSWVPSRYNTYLFEVQIDQDEVARTLDHIREVYWDTIAKGISLPADPNSEIDQELIAHLKNIQNTRSEMTRLVDDYLALRKANEEYLARNQANIDREEDMKARVKDFMLCNHLDRIGPVKLRSTEKNTFDFKTADVDGFDYKKYVKKTAVNMLTVVTNKE